MARVGDVRGSRRRLVVTAAFVVAVAAAAVVALYATSRGGTDVWDATEDDALPVLAMQVSGGNVVAMPGDGWAPRDGYVQLQLSGSSLPAGGVSSAVQDGGDLSVSLSADGGPAALDLVVTEYRLTGGDPSSVSRVVVTYPDGSTAELQRSCD